MSFVARGKRYLKARAAWIEAGRPIRSDQRVEEIYQTICRPCEHFAPNPRNKDEGKCRLCACNLNLGHRLNKLRWSTEKCPVDKWSAEVTLPGVVIINQGEAVRTQHFLREAEKQSNPRELRRRKREERRQAEAAIAEAIRQRREGLGETVDSLPGYDVAVSSGSAIEESKRSSAPIVKTISPRETNTDPLVIYDRNRKDTDHALRDMWAPCPAFIVGGGSSLKGVDLSQLAAPGVASLGINNAAAHARTSAFVCVDPIRKFHWSVFLDPTMEKFVPHTALSEKVVYKKRDGTFVETKYQVRDCPKVFAYLRNRHAQWPGESFFTEKTAPWGNGKHAHKKNGRPRVLCTLFTAIRLVHYFGCRRVYLLGVDFHMESGHGYAYNQERTERDAHDNNQIFRTAAAYMDELKPTIDRAGLEIYNCNPNSRLSTFPYVPFEEAIEDCRGQIPEQGKVDLSGWYEKLPLSEVKDDNNTETMGSKP